MLIVSKFILVCYLFYLCVETTNGQSLQYFAELSGDNNQCNFDVAQIYNATDLLRCINKLVSDTFSQDSSRSLRQQNKIHSMIHGRGSYEFSYGNLISYLFSNTAPSTDHDLPSNPIDYYQLNQPTINVAPSDQFNGFGINLYDALSSISRYDDLKCIPRIICEVASGRSPGEYRRASNYLNKLGKSIFTEWLSGFDIAATSPILYLARAAVLGYSSKENPTMCYRAFPRCPRNPDKLVNYLNNHNGGFFRFFNRDYGRIEADNIGTLKLKFNKPSVLTLNRDHRKTFFPREATMPINSKKIVFPVHDLSPDEPSKNRIPKSLSKLQETAFSMSSHNSPLFLPRKLKETDRRVFLTQVFETRL